MYTLTRTPQKTQLHDSNNTLILETYHDSITAGYDSPTDTKHGSIIIPTVVTSDQHGDGIETQVKRRNGKLSSKQLTRRLLTYAYTTNTLTPGTPVQDTITGRVHVSYWYYFWSFFPNPRKGT